MTINLDILSVWCYIIYNTMVTQLFRQAYNMRVVGLSIFYIERVEFNTSDYSR